jgi:hypothetical protein
VIAKLDAMERVCGTPYMEHYAEEFRGLVRLVKKRV